MTIQQAINVLAEAVAETYRQRRTDALAMGLSQETAELHAAMQARMTETNILSTLDLETTQRIKLFSLTATPTEELDR